MLPGRICTHSVAFLPAWDMRASTCTIFRPVRARFSFNPP